jgi:hypothetical protein
MTDSLELKRMDLLPLQAEEQTRVNGGLTFLPALLIAAPLVGVYVGVLGIAYYAGYGAHALYDAVNGNR